MIKTVFIRNKQFNTSAHQHINHSNLVAGLMILKITTRLNENERE